MRDPPNELFYDVHRKLMYVVVLIVSQLVLYIGLRTYKRVLSRLDEQARARLHGR